MRKVFLQFHVEGHHKRTRIEMKDHEGINYETSERIGERGEVLKKINESQQKTFIYMHYHFVSQCPFPSRFHSLSNVPLLSVVVVCEWKVGRR